MRFYIVLSVFLILLSSFTHAELPAELNAGLELYNNGELLEAYSRIKAFHSTKNQPLETSFLLALSKWKMMWLSTFSPSDKQEVISLLDTVEGITLPKMETDQDARFYYAAALALRAQISATEGDWWETAKLGKKMKREAELAIEKDPACYKAFFILGSYNYFADALPSYVKFLRSLLFVPGGDRTEGSRQLLVAYEKGGVVTGEAGRTLAIIYTFFEKRHDYGIRMCDNILSTYPHNFETRQYKGINLYFKKSWKESQQWFEDLQKRISEYSGKQPSAKNGEIAACYRSMDREVRYWIARSLIQQKKREEATKILQDLSKPEIHQPYWLMRGVYLSLAQIDYENKDPLSAEERLKKILRWQDVKESHDKAIRMMKKEGDVDTFDIDFL